MELSEKYMKKPEMIIFDYGKTLLYEPDWNSERGNRELMKYITKNPHNCTLEDIAQEIHTVFSEIEMVRDTLHYDIPCRVGDRLAYEHLGIEFSLTPLEHEIVFWTAATPGAITPNADIMLDYLNDAGIRTAVISNNGWSGEAIKERFDRLLPRNRFEFVMSSCDYMIRKPDKRLFEIALNKAGLTADKVWYCGDSIKADVCGSHSAGMFPVLYEGDIPSSEKRHYDNNGTEVDFEYLHIHDWLELIEILKERN